MLKSKYIIIAVVLVAVILIGFNEYQKKQYQIDTTAISVDPEVKADILDKNRNMLSRAQRFVKSKDFLNLATYQQKYQRNYIQWHKDQKVIFMPARVKSGSFAYFKEQFHQETCDLFKIPGVICIYGVSVNESKLKGKGLTKLEKTLDFEGVLDHHIQFWLNEVDLKSEITETMLKKNRPKRLNKLIEQYKYAIKETIEFSIDRNRSQKLPDIANRKFIDFCKKELTWLSTIKS